MLDSDIRVVLAQLLSAARSAAEELTDQPPNHINLTKRIVALALSWPVSNEQVHDTLDQICRKLSVTKQLKMAYDANWKNVAGAPPLESHSLHLLVALLLSHCRLDGSDAFDGRALKYFNAALELSDLAASEQHGGLPSVVRDWRDTILEQVGASVVRGNGL